MIRKSFGAQSIEEKLSSLLKPLFQGSKKEFIMINNLVKNWEQIIGKKYVDFCYPKSVRLEKKENNQGGKLTIAVYNPAIGFFLESNAEIILERIASFYGFKAISKIIIKQEPKQVKSNNQASEEIILSSEKEDFLKNFTSQISDQDLAKTLQDLGRQILKPQKK